ncbi:TRAUB-domain-containing protein [Polychaeton citri CBS 116435]|uniref:Protein BFR2 n=1 Tax=Polychaeton citri CBS 116435 TaxID=1314669 RepID=A0A9P4PZL4_9PEZI|nr:TRAUB-domain-containing protein [Polychaeton citri CBS 116435]
MAPGRTRNRAREFEELTKATAGDVDPEADGYADSDGDTESEESVDAGRDHYVDVGKSKLRKPKEIALGPQYQGAKVSRFAVEQDSEGEDDPFSKGFDEESSDGEESEEGGIGLESSGDEEEHDEEDESADDVSGDGTGDTDLSEEEDSAGASLLRKRKAPEEDDRAELRKIMATEQKAVAASISQTNREDAEKGRAVKRQRKCFDALLNTRIKLQKSLISTNTIVGTSKEVSQGIRQAALEAAETAAFNLWSNVNELREIMLTEKTGKKRKRLPFDSQTSVSDLWQHMQAQEAGILPQRNATLQRWSAKARGASALPQRSKINNTATEATIIDVLQEHLNAPDRLIKRAHTPRSCAPLQLSQKVVEDDKIYDDADFYGLLLKELLEQKSADSIATANVMGMDFGRMRREAKAKKDVDTKASKGRKLRYTVHEKLQNFMAPEDRGSWGEKQSDDLFGSLFGQKMKDLREDDSGDEDAQDVHVDADEAGMLMFRR